MAFFEGIKMTAGYNDGPDIISSCSINVDRGEIVAILSNAWFTKIKIRCSKN